ncbi:MAG: hypothetical protein IKJ45_06795 [Kiritimatiellae bacterium]|nr:hypothetical protein [Kiritimatiellia bacterium]
MKRISVGTVIVSMFACVVIADAMPERYFSGKRRILSTDTATIPGSVITHYRQGEKEWSTTNVLKVVNVRPVIRYSKLKLVVAAKAAGKWADVKAFIQAHDMMDEWSACQYLTSDYPAYIAATNAVVSLGVATDAEVKAFMKAAED